MKAVEIRTNQKGQTGFNGNRFWLSLATDLALGLKPDSRYALMAVKLPDGYRIATDEDKAGIKPKNSKRLSGQQRFIHSPHKHGWRGRFPVYAVPITPPAPVIKITVDGTEVTLSDETVAAIREAVAK